MDENAKRWMLFILLATPLLMLYMNGQTAKMKQRAEAQERIKRQQEALQGPIAPAVDATTSGTLTPSAQAPAPEAPPLEAGEEIRIETETYAITFNTAGAVPTHWQIVDPEFAKATQSDIDVAEKADQTPPAMGDFKPIEIIPQYEGIDPGRDYPLSVVLKESAGGYFQELNRNVYTVKGPEDATGPDGEAQKVLTFTSPVTREGLRLTKIFRFSNKGYMTHLEVRLDHTAPPGKGQRIAFNEAIQPGLGLNWGPGIGSSHYEDRWDGSYYKVAVYDDGNILSNNFSKWDEAQTRSVTREWPSGEKPLWNWAMLDSRFYAAAVLPDEPVSLVRGVVKSMHVPDSESLRKNMAPPLSIEVYDGPFTLEPGQSHVRNYTLFVGPKQYSLLKSIDKRYTENLRRILFQSDWWIMDKVIRPLAVFMLILLGWFSDLTGSYGVAIILVVLVMRLLTQPFTHMGMKSQARVMAEQRRIKPLIDAINEKYKDDSQKRSAETWKTYKEHGVNPLGMLKGCGWMLVQMPIFLALYRLLIFAIDLRGQSFLWIDDLTAPDALFTLPFTLPLLGNKLNILPILMGISQLFAQRLQSSNIEDPMQKQMATIMPIMFIFMLYNFAAGLSLYWFVSNIWQIVFQVFVNRRVKEEAEQKAHRAFDERQKAIQTSIASGAAKKTKTGKSTWQERIMAYLEQKTKEGERTKRTQGKKR